MLFLYLQHRTIKQQIMSDRHTDYGVFALTLQMPARIIISQR